MTQQKIKTIFDDVKLKMTAKPIEQGARPPTLQLGTYRNNPQFVVYPNHDNGSGVTWITAAMNMGTFSWVLQGIIYLVDNVEGEETFSIDNKKDIPKEKRTDPKITKQVVSKTMVGREADGRIWISIQDNTKPNAPKIRFYFGIDYYHSVSSKNGTFTPAVQSQIQAKAWATQMSALMYGLSLNNPNAEIDAANAQAGWQNKKGGGNGGGGYNKGGNGGGYNKGGQGYANKSTGASSGDNFGGNDGFDDGAGGDDW